MASSWMETTFEAWMLVVEASSVIALRTVTIGTGGVGATHESLRMITEKVEAVIALQSLAMTGGVGAGEIVTHYRSIVQSNLRRLRFHDDGV
jgi:hypothetical protein